MDVKYFSDHYDKGKAAVDKLLAEKHRVVWHSSVCMGHTATSSVQNCSVQICKFLDPCTDTQVDRLDCRCNLVANARLCFNHLLIRRLSNLH